MKRALFILILAALLCIISGCGSDVEYEGEMKEGLPHGTGTLVHPGGATYSGEFKEGLRHGEGTWTHPNGTSYSGSWQNDLYHGQGTLTIPGSLTYEGEWVAGLREGYGIQTWADGSRFEGTWKEDRRHGSGVMLYADGDRYEGDWLKGKREGEGTLVTAEGEIFSGEWINDEYFYIPVEHLSLNTDSLTLTLSNYTFAIEAFIYPPDASEPDLTWTSSEPDIVMVDEGIVTPLATGEALITATALAEEISAQCRVTVIEAPISVYAVTLNEETLYLYTSDDPVSLTATVIPGNATDPTVYWRSSNPDVATVSPTGRVTPQGTGEATITVTTTDGGHSAECTVIVRHSIFSN